MADNTNKVTIDAAWFAELYAAKKDKDQYAEAVMNIAKERDELKAANEDLKSRVVGDIERAHFVKLENDYIAEEGTDDEGK